MHSSPSAPVITSCHTSVQKFTDRLKVHQIPPHVQLYIHVTGTTIRTEKRSVTRTSCATLLERQPPINS